MRLGSFEGFVAALNSLVQPSSPAALFNSYLGLRGKPWKKQLWDFQILRPAQKLEKGKDKMKQFIWFLVVGFIPSSVACAQDSPKVEITGYYSYFRFYPENNGTLSSHYLNGGGADVSVFLMKMLGIKAEFGGYQGNLDTHTSGSSVASASANLFTYNIGPVVKLRTKLRTLQVEPFGEALFGGAHSSFYSNLCKVSQGCLVNNPSNNAFDFVMGGGLDIPLSRAIAFRPVQVDYVLTRFGNGFTAGNQNQSNLRYQIGVQFRF